MTIEKERTQIGWGSLGTKLFADIPVTNERLWFDMAELHETWKDYLLMYGVKQFASSNISGESFPFKAERLAARAENPEMTEDEIDVIVREKKTLWLKANAPNLRTALWNELESLKAERTKKERAGKETKAAVEARVKAETVEKMKAGLRLAGLTDEQIAIALKNI